MNIHCKSNVFWTRQCCCTDELTVAVTLCTEPAQDQSSQHYIMDEQPLATEWLMGKGKFVLADEIPDKLPTL